MLVPIVPLTKKLKTTRHKITQLKLGDYEGFMNDQDVLIVSSHREIRKMILQTLEGLPVSVFCSSTLAGAREVLSSHPLAVTFCEERFSDGTYRQLLSDVTATGRTNRFIVVLNTDEWEENLEALRLGASETLRCPLRPPDIDIALIRAIRHYRSAHARSAGA